MALVKKTGINFTRVFDILAYQREKYPNAKALSSRVDHQWKSYSIYQIQDRIDHVSAWLMAKELTKGDHVVLVPEAGSPEWMILDFACQQIGVISVILYPTLKATEVKRILSEV
ncbi:MAG: AMP-binding protein, partial [Saprospiraceae bacterium]|nr:AMP-binding protein [Saprospiraceae bacterium]